MSNDDGGKVFKKVIVTVEFDAIVAPPEGGWPQRGLNQRLSLAKVAELLSWLNEQPPSGFAFEPVSTDVVDIVVNTSKDQ